MRLRTFVRTGIGKLLMTSATERQWDTLFKMMDTEAWPRRQC